MRRSARITVVLLVCALAYVNGHCLIADNAFLHSRCLIEENLANETDLKAICNSYDTNHKLTIVAVYQNHLKSYRELQNYCTTGAIGRLSWIKYSLISEYLLNSKDVDMKLPRVIRHSKTMNLIHNELQDHDAEILLENLPLRYELRNVERTAWENVTKVGTIMLAHEHFRNDDTKSVLLTREPMLKTNHTMDYVFEKGIANDMEIQIYHDNTIYRTITGQPRPVDVEHQTHRIRKRISPVSQMNVDVVGTIAKVWYEIEGDLAIAYYDFKDEKRIKARIIETKIIDIRDQATMQTKIRAPKEDEPKEMDIESRNRTFNIISIVAMIVFFAVVGTIWTHTIITMVRYRREKKKQRMEMLERRRSTYRKDSLHYYCAPPGQENHI